MKRSYFVFARGDTSSSPPFAFSRRAPCSSRSAICHLVVYFRCPDPSFSLSRHLRNTKADLSEFYVSKRVIVLATCLRRLLRRFHTDSASSACLSVVEVSREGVYLTCQKFPCIFTSNFLYTRIVDGSAFSPLTLKLFKQNYYIYQKSVIYCNESEGLNITLSFVIKF